MRTHFLVVSRRNLLAMLRHLDQMPHSHGRDTDTMTVDLVEGQVPPLDDGSKVVTTLRMWGADPAPSIQADIEKCPECFGTGARAVAGFLCPKCRGIGFLASTTIP